MKYSAEKIFNGYHFQKDIVIITDDDGTITDIVPVADAGDNVQHFDGILTPGFINCHCHLELSHMKGMIPEGTGLIDFVVAVVQQRHLSNEIILKAIDEAENEMLENGIVSVGDIVNNAMTIPQKLKGRLWYHNFVEASGFNPAIVRERFERSVGFFRAYGQLYSIPIESNSIVPHAPYSVAKELWDLIIGFPGNHVMTIHNQEAEGEDEWFKNKRGPFTELYEKLKIDTSYFQASGKSAIQTYLPNFLRNQSLILVHNTETSEEDIIFAQGTKDRLYWCLCPNANKYITGKMPPIDILTRNDCTIVLGTDSLASNHQLSIVAEMKTLKDNFPQLQLEQLLKWGTSNGAKALQVDGLVGSFEKGKKPGIVKITEDLSSIKKIL